MPARDRVTVGASDGDLRAAEVVALIDQDDRLAYVLRYAGVDVEDIVELLGRLRDTE